MADAKNRWCNSQRTQSIIMSGVGVLVWSLANTETELARNLVPGLGLFLFLYGATTINPSKEWCAFSKKQKITKITLAVGLGILVAVLMVFLLKRA